MDAAKGFTGWAVVEVMGHRRIAGHCTEMPVAGTALLRVEVPETPADADGGRFARGATEPRVECLGGAAIFALHPCDEATARAAARDIESHRAPYLRPVSSALALQALHAGPDPESAGVEWEDDDDATDVEFVGADDDGAADDGAEPL